MAVSSTRKLVLAVVIAALIAAIAVASIPLLVSTSFIRDRLASDIGNLIGYRVELRQSPEVQVFPRLTATLRGVVVSDWTNPEGPPAAEAEAVAIDLSPIAAIRGRMEFDAIRVVRPVVRVDSDIRALSEFQPSYGRIARALRIAREALEANPGEPDFGQIPNDRIGRISVVDGSVLIGKGEDDRSRITGIAGNFDWPALNQPLRIDTKAIWNGGEVSVQGTIANPIVLIAEGTSSASVRLSSAAVSAAFDGRANFSANPYAEGAIQLDTPSFAQFMRWSTLDIGAGSALGTVKIGANLSGKPTRFKLSDLALTLDGTTGTGVLDVGLDGAMPEVAGTLDFPELDLASLLSAFVPLPDQPVLSARRLDTGFIDELALDLRLSADRARAGTLVLSDVAASAQIKGGIAAFDLNDARVFEGTAQAALRIDARKDVPEGELRLAIEDATLGSMQNGATDRRFRVSGKGNLSVLLRGVFEDWGSFRETASGTFLFRSGPGKFDGINLDSLADPASSGSVLALSALPEGSFNFNAAEIRGVVENSNLRIDTGQFDGDPLSLSLNGVVSWPGQSLALVGKVARKTASEPASWSYFVGGSLENPFVSAVLAPRPGG